jgi:site-specific DNA recombinase
MPARALSKMRSTSEQAQRLIPAVLRARVSSKEQEEEGFSLPAQIRPLQEYAVRNGFLIVQEFIDVESSKTGGRTGFTEMVGYLKKHQTTCRTILVEKTDRLYRNIKDWAVLDEIGVTIHFVKEGLIIGPDSRSNEQFVHGIKVLMARNYSQNLGEETTKGMLEKARTGIYPSFAPAGYRNVDGPNGKRIIVPDPDSAPVITELFRRFATGSFSLTALVTRFRTEGITFRGRKLQKSTVHQILRKRLYMGDFDWDGTTYAGTHDPLVSRDCWDRVQKLLDDRVEKKTRKVKHDFAFTGLITCGHCGCLMVGELKKGRYIYYHCTGNRGKFPEPYTRQEILTSNFANILQDLVIPQPILDWLGDAVLQSDRTEQAARDQFIKRLQSRCDQIQDRIETMYMDKLAGRITQDFFDRKAAEWRHEQDGIRGRIQEIQRTAPAPVDDAIDMLRLTSRASELFLEQPPIEQRRLLQVVMEKADWKNGMLRTTLLEPFEILRHSNRESCRKENKNAGSGRDLEVWLRD